MTKVVSWNIATMQEPWRELVEMDADVALLQEVAKRREAALATLDAKLARAALIEGLEVPSA